MQQPTEEVTESNQQPSFTTATDSYGAKLCHRECSCTESSQVWSPDCFSFQTGISNTCLHHCWPATSAKENVKCLRYWWSWDLSATKAVDEAIKKARRAFFAYGAIEAFQGKLNPLSARQKHLRHMCCSRLTTCIWRWELDIDWFPT